MGIEELKQKNSFNINPSPEEMARKDEVLYKAYNDLVYFGRAFLPNDFLNKYSQNLTLLKMYLKN